MSVNSMMVCILANILYVPADRVFMAIHMAVITEINVFGVEWFVSPHFGASFHWRHPWNIVIWGIVPISIIPRMMLRFWVPATIMTWIISVPGVSILMIGVRILCGFVIPWLFIVWSSRVFLTMVFFHSLSRKYAAVEIFNYSSYIMDSS